MILPVSRVSSSASFGALCRHEIGEAVEKLAALRRGHRRPGATHVKARRAAVDGAVDVALAGLGHLGPGLARRGIKAVEARLAVLEHAVDVVLELAAWLTPRMPA